MPAVDETTTPEGWAVTVRAKYDLTETEATLVDLAEQALSLARTETVAAPVRLAAMARFQALVKQLQLEEEADGEVEAPAAGQWPRRVV